MFNHKLKTNFRLYQAENSKFKSTLFDLIDGDRETKQTKGLAYLFHLSPEFLKEFLSIEKLDHFIRKRLTNTQYKMFLGSDYLKVDAEMISVGSEKIRRDITLTFYYKSSKALVIIIEAKSIKLTSNHSIEKQLQTYVDIKYFPHDEHTPKTAIALTKYKQSFSTDSFLSITWTDMIQALHKTCQKSMESTMALILKEYYNFITGVENSMNYYEKEILSVPAGKTFEEINKYHIHACPHTSSYNYRDPLFITFRQKGGGVMDKLFKIEDIFILSPESESELNVMSESDFPYRDRLLAYITVRKAGFGFKKNDTYRFYILSQEEHISLPHRPHPAINNSGGWYYTLSEMLRGREIVNTDSR
jgi:hypothetical protein